MNRYYRASRFIYDVTRKYFLFGRDVALQRLAADPEWSSLAEMGPGTGRNLAWLHRVRPAALLAGIEASDAMLNHARGKCPWASLVHGFAEDASVEASIGMLPDRILFSYCLSMVRSPHTALTNARRSLPPRGSVLVVDFADMERMPSALCRALRSYLRLFHVQPLESDLLQEASSVQFGPGRYYVLATFGPLKSVRPA